MAHILLIESDRVLAQNISAHLNLKGHSIDWQVSPQDAITSADKKIPDIVIMDLLLAARSGIEFLYEFRSYPDWATLPVIVLSSVPVQDLGVSISHIEDLGVAAFHYKHATPLSSLSYAIDQALQTAQAA